MKKVGSSLKKKLMYTGWLQYIITMVLATMFLVVGFILSIVFNITVGLPFLAISAVLLLIDMIDIIMIKYDIRPKESFPDPLDELNVFDVMRSRRSCRSFQRRDLRTEDYKELMLYVEKESSLVNDSVLSKGSIRFEYIHAPLTVWPVVGAQEFLVAIAPFDSYYQGENSEKKDYEGVGLGLSICKDILTNHDGRIRVKSVVGVGSVFTLFIPVV
jgi:hypothetical protein